MFAPRVIMIGGKAHIHSLKPLTTGDQRMRGPKRPLAFRPDSGPCPKPVLKGPSVIPVSVPVVGPCALSRHDRPDPRWKR